MHTPHSIPDLPEQWRVVPGWEMYEVSTLGRVRSLARTVTNSLGVTQTFKSFIRKTAPNCNGYPFFSVQAKERPHTNLLVHRAVLEAFVGECPLGWECAHWDGDRTNARLSNLRWDTPYGNCADKLRHNTHRRGDRSNFARLTWYLVREIRSLPKDSTLHEIAEAYGVTDMTIHGVLNWRTWREADSPPPTPTGAPRKRSR